jgi:N-acetylglucosaminyldiphosphoundecaprenol N-acetyl-beta-D-mannosaminyltransferase
MANILGIKLTDLTVAAVKKLAANFLTQGGQHYLVTPNPEIILASHHDEELFYILNQADLAIPDGVGLQLAARLNYTQLHRLTGADLTIYLLNLAQEKNLKITVLNWCNGLSNKNNLTVALTKNYPQLNQLVIDIERTSQLTEPVITSINNFAPDLLFVTLGSPYQEKLIYHNLQKLPSVKLALGVGGAFDFISGRAQRAPQLLRSLGLEWLWRLIQQPSRWRRIYQATIVFSYKVLLARFIHPFLFRPNVACLLYKKENNSYKVLIVAREGDPNHWQLPQGGTDGESLAQAGAREMREELGTTNFTTTACFTNLSRYTFTVDKKNNDKSGKKYKYDYKGQKQGLYIAEFTGQDQDIKLNFWDHVAWRWVEYDQLVQAVHPLRRPSTQIFLDKFKSLRL